MNQFLLRAVLLLLACQSSASVRATAETPDKAAKIDTLDQQYEDCWQFTGTVLVTDHDNMIFKKGYGLANREWRLPNTPDVKFRIGSITKQFTSMLVRQPVAKGTIKLDGRLCDYLPYYCKDTGSRVTQLLNHTPGIPSYTGDPKFSPDDSRNCEPRGGGGPESLGAAQGEGEQEAKIVFAFYSPLR